MKLFFYCFLFFLTSLANAQTHLKIKNGDVQLDGYFYAAQTADGRKAPAIVALHGCGGMLGSHDQPNMRSKNYAQLLNGQGWHVLFLDSFTSRGVKSVCGGNQQVTQAQRVTDVQAAIAFLAKRVDVDADRLGILGWSHGGSTTLLANDKNVAYAAAPRAAFAYYPGCGNGIDLGVGRADWQAARPVLMQLGAVDDWTNPIFCQRLAARSGTLVKQDTYANANHGFDSEGSTVIAIHLNTPRGAKTVHTGGEPAAKAAAQAKLIAFFKEHFK